MLQERDIVRPISSRFLNDSASYKPVTGRDAYQNPTYGTVITISRFLASAPKRTVVSATGEQADDRLEIFFDVKKSLPIGQTFSKGDVVIYNGEEYIIREAQVFPTIAKPHHWVVRLA
jgi:hypothetical protein